MKKSIDQIKAEARNAIEKTQLEHIVGGSSGSGSNSVNGIAGAAATSTRQN